MNKVGSRRARHALRSLVAGFAMATLATWPLLSAAQDQNSEDKAEIAREAYEPEDSKPIENWFGCPPKDEDTGQDAAEAPDESPSSGQDNSEQDGNCSAEQPPKQKTPGSE